MEIKLKGAKLCCKNCNDHILTFAKDINFGDSINVDILEKEAGQGPWNNYEEMRCRKCYTKYNVTDIDLTPYLE